MEAYEREWADLYRRMVQACLRLRRGRSPEEDVVLDVVEEMVQACLRLRRGRSPEEDAVLDVVEEWIRRSIEGAERSRESR